MRYKVRALPLYAILIDPSKTLSYTKVSRRKKDRGVPLLSLPLPHPSHPSLTLPHPSHPSLTLPLPHPSHPSLTPSSSPFSL